jgi:hypothetical protein
MAEYLQGNPQIMDNIQNTIGSGIDKFKSGLGSIKDFAMDKGRMGKNLLGSAGAMAMGLPGMVGSGVMSLLSGLGNGADYQKYTPGFDYSKFNPNMEINDFYDPRTKTNRFDRAKPGSFASARTGAEYFKARREKKAACNNKAKSRSRKSNIYGQELKELRIVEIPVKVKLTGFGKSGLGRDPNDRMADGGRVGLASMFTRRR